MPTSTADAPTKLWSMATSSGISVIATRRATTSPIPPPASITAIKIQRVPVFPVNRVAATAIVIPSMPYRFPFRAVS